MDQLFNHFSDIPALQKEKKQVLDILAAYGFLNSKPADTDEQGVT